MSAAMLKLVLQDFGAPTIATSPLPVVDQPAPAAPLREPPPAVVDAARQENERLRAAIARLESQLEDARTDMETQAQSQADEVARAAERLMDKVESAIRAVEMRVADACVAILAPMAREHARERVVKETLSHINAVLTRNSAVRLKFTGSRLLIDALKERLGASSAAIVAQADDSDDIRVEFDDAMIMTQLALWRRSILEAVERRPS